MEWVNNLENVDRGNAAQETKEAGALSGLIVRERNLERTRPNGSSH